MAGIKKGYWRTANNFWKNGHNLGPGESRIFPTNTQRPRMGDFDEWLFLMIIFFD